MKLERASTKEPASRALAGHVTVRVAGSGQARGGRADVDTADLPLICVILCVYSNLSYIYRDYSVKGSSIQRAWIDLVVTSIITRTDLKEREKKVRNREEKRIETRKKEKERKKEM
jgi:hypothetical protein